LDVVILLEPDLEIFGPVAAAGFAASAAKARNEKKA
jgi:hypothetical protein